MKDSTTEYINKEEGTTRIPVELYHIWRDGGDHVYYTDGDVLVNFESNDYEPATLSRGAVSCNSQLEVSTLSIQVSRLTLPVLEYISINPVEILWVSVMKLFRDQDPLEASIIFIGQIKNVSFKGPSANVHCVGFEHFLKQTIPIWRYQLNCNHFVFDTKCSLVKADYKVTATVTLDSTGTELTSSAFSGYDDGYFIGGEVISGVEFRMVIAHVGDVITLMYKMKELSSNDSVDAYPGCDGRVETCRDKFSNIDNFLGFPFIPVENPAMRLP